VSNIQVFNPGAMRPSYANKGELSAVAKALAGGGASGKRLSVKGCVFRLMVDGKEVTSIEDRYLDVVIVNAAPKVSRVFYAGVYVDGATAPPVCWSKAGDTPDSEVKNPQSASCSTCPQNVRGSGQGDTRACRYSQQTAIVLANDMEGDVMQLSLAATSIFGKAEGENRPLQDYVRFMMAQGIDVTQLITRLKFDTKVATPKLFFKPMRWLTDDENEVCQKQGQTPDAIRAITMTVSQTDGVAPAATSTPAPFKPPAADEEPPPPPPRAAKPAPAPARAAAPAPAPALEDDEPPAPPPSAPRRRSAAAVVAAAAAAPVPEPTVRTAAPAASSHAAATTSLAQTLADWGDE